MLGISRRLLVDACMVRSRFRMPIGCISEGIIGAIHVTGKTVIQRPSSRTQTIAKIDGHGKAPP
jgi:hypothetical protein